MHKDYFYLNLCEPNPAVLKLHMRKLIAIFACIYIIAR